VADENKSEIIAMTADVVAAYVSNNSMSAEDLPQLIKSIHGALVEIEGGAAVDAPAARPEPAVPIKKAVQPDHIVDLFTGRKFKSLKRHLRTKHNMTPEEYRTYWGLPKDSPMVAPNYAAARSQLAKSMGLGQGGRKPAKAPVRKTKA
jgi:predicted transcriptional regulator